MVGGEKRISIRCVCGKSLRVKAELAGKKVRCPTCNHVLLVPRSGGAQGDTQWQQKLNTLTKKLEVAQANFQDVLKEKDTEIKRLQDELAHQEAELKKVESKIAQHEKDYQVKIRALEKVRTQLIKLSQEID